MEKRRGITKVTMYAVRVWLTYTYRVYCAWRNVLYLSIGTVGENLMTFPAGWPCSSETWRKQMKELRERPLELYWYEGYLYINGSLHGYGMERTRHRPRIGEKK